MYRGASRLLELIEEHGEEELIEEQQRAGVAWRLRSGVGFDGEEGATEHIEGKGDMLERARAQATHTHPAEPEFRMMSINMISF
ncbi:hypothetical protein GOP47_0008039 [Adiantum capillus-veneris]|uniref:Uncharacterized protein n=1 Tax=Adiantum capillus-veneris TaxID=13818 RepID=A0A9D4UXZ5_ADICA|nr:hypothetical protein GOP47_0008039 [Adiantum capillus-veneris]